MLTPLAFTGVASVVSAHFSEFPCSLRLFLNKDLAARKQLAFQTPTIVRQPPRYLQNGCHTVWMQRIWVSNYRHRRRIVDNRFLLFCLENIMDHQTLNTNQHQIVGARIAFIRLWHKNSWCQSSTPTQQAALLAENALFFPLCYAFQCKNVQWLLEDEITSMHFVKGQRHKLPTEIGEIVKHNHVWYNLLQMTRLLERTLAWRKCGINRWVQKINKLPWCFWHMDVSHIP